MIVHLRVVSGPLSVVSCKSGKQLTTDNGPLTALFNIYPALCGDSARFHNDIIVNGFTPVHPRFNLFDGATQSEGQLLIARIESLVAQVFEQRAPLALIGAAIIDGFSLS